MARKRKRKVQRSKQDRFAALRMVPGVLLNGRPFAYVDRWGVPRAEAGR